MGTVNSLICWGGKTGKQVASINTSTDQLTITDHGLRSGLGVQFESWVSAPTVSGTALALNTTYYAKYISQSAFELYYDSGLTTKIDFTAAGTTLYLISAFLKGLGDTSRWGHASYSNTDSRIYDGVQSWNSGRGSTSPFDVEVAEVGEAFTEIASADLIITVPSAVNRIETKIDGVRSPGFHYGKVGDTLANLTLAHGYVYYGTAATTSIFRITKQLDVIDGISAVWAGSTSRNVFDISARCALYHSIATCSVANFGTGVNVRAAFSEVVGCIFTRLSVGMVLATSQSGLFVANNTVANCSTPITAGASVLGRYYNNLVAGAWPTQPTTVTASGNSGATGATPWVSAGSTSYTVNTSDFLDYAGKDFRPLNGSSPQVDTGVLYYSYPTRDIRNLERPAYNNGGSEAIDIGAYEHDPGFGPHPAETTLTLTNVVTGSAYRIEDTADDSLIEAGTAASSTVVVTMSYPGSPLTLRIKVRKGTAAPKYLPFDTQAVVGAAGASVFISQSVDTIAA